VSAERINSHQGLRNKAAAAPRGGESGAANGGVLGRIGATSAGLAGASDNLASGRGTGGGGAALQHAFFADDVPPGALLGLRASDWNLACNIAFHSRLANIPAASFDSAFTEVMRLMREANVDFEDGTMRTLLRYLVFSQPESELTGRILKRMHRGG